MQHRVEFDGEGGGVADGKWKLTCASSASTDSTVDASNTASASPRLPAAVKAESTETFDEQEYRVLQEHFFEPVVACNVELPNGQVLRRQTKPPRMNQPTAGFIKLAQQPKYFCSVATLLEPGNGLAQLDEPCSGLVHSRGLGLPAQDLAVGQLHVAGHNRLKEMLL